MSIVFPISPATCHLGEVWWDGQRGVWHSLLYGTTLKYDVCWCFDCWATCLFKSMWIHLHDKSMLKTYSWYQQFINDCIVRRPSNFQLQLASISTNHWWAASWLINLNINSLCICISNWWYTKLSIHNEWLEWQIFFYHIRTDPGAHMIGTIYLAAKRLGMKLITQFHPRYIYLHIYLLFI
jgi:hypothetical protein